MQALLGVSAPDAATGLLANEQLPRWPEAVANATSVPDTATPAPPAPLPASATQRPQSSEPMQTAQQAAMADAAAGGASPPADIAASEQEDRSLQRPGSASDTVGAQHQNQLDMVRLLAGCAKGYDITHDRVLLPMHILALDVMQVKRQADESAASAVQKRMKLPAISDNQTVTTF